jgi:hypothetical protein
MNKQTKLLIGLGLVGIGGYLYWKSTQKKANLTKSVKPVKSPVTPSCQQLMNTGVIGMNYQMEECQQMGATAYLLQQADMASQGIGTR